MSVQWTIPHQARYIQTGNMFAADFNVPILGRYSFTVPANLNQVVLQLQPNTEYLIERVTVAGDIDELIYAGALDLGVQANAPFLRLRRLLDGQNVYNTAIGVPSYITQQESAVWVHSDRLGDALTATFTGVMFQTAPLVGIPTIRLAVTFSIYAIESTIYNRAFRGSQSVGLADRVRG